MSKNLKKTNLIAPSFGEKTGNNADHEVNCSAADRRTSASERKTPPATSSKRRKSSSELANQDMTKNQGDIPALNVNSMQRRSPDGSEKNCSKNNQSSLRSASASDSSLRSNSCSSTNHISVDQIVGRVNHDKRKAVIPRASRSESPERGPITKDTQAKSPPIPAAAMTSHGYNTKEDSHHKRSSSDPSVVPKAEQAHRPGTSTPPQGIPIHVSPKNLVLRFDARKDNLSFSAIKEKDEAENPTDLISAGREGSMERNADTQINDYKAAAAKSGPDNQLRTRDVTPPLRDFAGRPASNGLDPSPGNVSNNNKSSKSSGEKKKKGYWYNIKIKSGVVRRRLSSSPYEIRTAIRYGRDKVLSPNYKSKSEDFRKIFKDVPDTERLIVDYSCAMQKDILVHGRLYITQNWVCFYANIFKWETVLTIQCKDITSIQKEKTARVIPNAISVCTKDERHFFTSFGARDKSYLMMFRVWQNALCDVQMNPSELWQWVHYSYGDELGLTSSDDDYVAPDTDADAPFHLDNQLDLAYPPSGGSNKEPGEEDSLLSSPGSQQPNGTLSPNDSISNVTDVSNYEKPVSRKGKPPASLDVPAPGAPSAAGAAASSGHGEQETPIDMGDTTEDDDLNATGEVQCASHEHNGFTSLDDIFNIPVDRLYDCIFSDSQMYRDFIAARKTFDFVTEPWPEQPNAHGNKVRNISYTLSLNYSIGPKTSPSTEKQTYFGAYSKPGSIHVVDTEVVNGGVPYSDNFYVVNRYCFTRVSNHRSRLRITSQIRYRKNCWGLVKRMVDKAAHDGLHTNFGILGEFLHKESDRVSSTASGQHAASKKKVLKKRRLAAASATERASHGKHGADAPPGAQAKEAARDEQHINFNIDLLVKAMCLMLILLVFFNAVLYYKLWSLELHSNTLGSPLQSPQRDTHYSQIPKNTPKSDEEWMQLLQQQQQLHDEELNRWQEILATSIKLMDHMKLTLSELKVSLERRHSYTPGMQAPAA